MISICISLPSSSFCGLTIALVCCRVAEDVNVLLGFLVILLVLAKRHLDDGGRRKSRIGGGAMLEKCLREGVSLRKALAVLGD